ncbi:MAG: endonuclease [Paludibacteraceae bacterium]|nr:endonuclease [Paludibacteraceae bacterium]
MKRVNDIFAGKHRRGLLLVLICGIYTLSVWGVDASYYSSANGKSDASLRDALYSITSSGPSGMSYAGLWTAYKTTDVYPTGHANAGKIWDMYSTCVFTYSTDQCGNYSNECDCYNREHSLPKSWFNEATPMYYDLGHIVPTDGYVNNKRSNYPFGEVNSASYSYGGSKLGTAKSVSASNTIVNTSGSTTQTCASTVFEPADDYKGDFARMYMYMRVRYYNTNFTQDGSYGKYHFSTTYTKAGYYGLTAYSVALLMKWHRQDPVSQKEIDRNNAMQTVQGNRNPFIDYPCLAEYLWGEHTGETFSTSTSIGSFESSFTPGSSDGCSSGGGSSTTNYTLTWKVNGTTSSTTTSSGSSVGSVPSAPSAPSACSDKVFVGWSTTNIGSTATNTAPSVLFTDASGAPSISANTTFYAVFATSSSGGESSSTITFTPGADTGATSVTKSGVTCTMSTMNNASYYQIYANTSGTFSCSSGNITQIQFTCTASGTTKYGPGNASADVGSYSYSGSTGTWTGSASSVSISSTAQVRMTTLSVTISGGATYSAYVTQCSGSSSCSSAPTLGAASTSNVTTTGATIACSSGITSLGSSGCSVTAYGFVYGTTSNPTLTSGTAVQVGTSYTSTSTAFSTTLTGLSASTTYYVRPYATNGYGTGYGSQASFTTKTPTSYTVTWKVNGSTYTTGSPTTSVVEGNKVTTLPATPSAPSACSSYTFVGWSTTNCGSTGTTTKPTDLFTTAANSPAITSNTTFYAVYSATSGSGSSSSTVTETFESQTASTTYNSTQTYTAENSNAGLAWTIYYGTVSTNSKITGNNSAQMRWYSSATTSYGYAQTTTAIQGLQSITFNAKVSNTNLKMSVWYSTNQSAWTALATNVTMTTGSKSYTYNVNGTSGTNYYIRIGVGNGGTAPSSGNYSLTIDDVAFTSTTSGSTIYYSECAAASSYTVTWNATTNGGSCSTATSTVTAGNAIGTLPTATKDCYTFNGWYTAASSGTKITSTTVPTGNVTYYAQFSINSHTLTVAASPTTYGSVSGGGTYNCGTSHTITATANTGYTFSYWSLNGSSVSTNASYSVTMPDEDVTYTAVFIAGTASYTVKHYQQNTDGSTYPATPTETESKSGTTGGTTAATAKSYTGFTAQSFSQQTIAADGSTVVSIYYTRNTYTISYNKGSYGTGTNSSDTKLYGVALTLPATAMFTRTGYVQTGWSTSTYGTTKTYDLGASYTANSAITLYPYWEQLASYTATFKNGEDTYSTKTGYEGQSISVGTPTACDGFTFVGWSSHEYDNTTSSPIIDFDGTIPSGNTTYHAVYSKQGNATTVLTNNYERITTAAELTNGNYLVVGYYNYNYYAMRAVTTNTYYLAQTAVTPSSNIISNPAANLIWQVTVSGSNVTFYNANAAQYAYAYRYGTTNYLNLTTGTAGTSFAASIANSEWTFTSNTYTGYRISYQGNNSRFRLYNTAGNPIYLYKQMEETSYTTYYTTSTTFTVTVVSEDTQKGTVSISDAP